MFTVYSELWYYT